MSLRSGTQKYGTSTDEFVMIDGYNRNLVLEKRLQQELEQVNNEVSALGEFNPNSGYALPSWWETVSDPGGYGWGFDTHQKALDYLKLSKRFHEAKINSWEYACKNYPRDTVFCQHASQYQGILGRINTLISIIESRISVTSFDIIPQVFAEEDPSVLQSDERITLPSIYGGQYVPGVEPKPITTPIVEEPSVTTDHVEPPEQEVTLPSIYGGQYVPGVEPTPQPQPQPPVTQPPVITTVHIPPPEMPVEEPPITVTPTEPGQINWIPEPFFSFINNVFRR